MGGKRKAENDIDADGERSLRRQRPADSPASQQQQSINPFSGIQIVKVGGKNDSNPSRRPTASSSSLFATTISSKSTIKTPNALGTNNPAWNRRLGHIQYAFFKETLALLKEDPHRDWVPRADDLFRTIMSLRDAYKEELDSIKQGGSASDENNKSSSNTNNGNNSSVSSSTKSPAAKQPPILQQPSSFAASTSKTTPYTPASTSTFSGAAFGTTPNGSSIFGNPVFSPMAAPPAVDLGSSSTFSQQPTKNDLDPQQQLGGDNNDDELPLEPPVKAAKVADKEYEDILELPNVILFRNDAGDMKKQCRGPLRVQSKIVKSDGDPPNHRLVIREPLTGKIHFNETVASCTPFRMHENKDVGSVHFVANFEGKDSKYAIKAKLEDAKRLFATFQGLP